MLQQIEGGCTQTSQWHWKATQSVNRSNNQKLSSPPLAKECPGSSDVG